MRCTVPFQQEYDRPLFIVYAQITVFKLPHSKQKHLGILIIQQSGKPAAVEQRASMDIRTQPAFALYAIGRLLVVCFRFSLLLPAFSAILLSVRLGRDAPVQPADGERHIKTPARYGFLICCIVRDRDNAFPLIHLEIAVLPLCNVRDIHGGEAIEIIPADPADDHKLGRLADLQRAERNAEELVHQRGRGDLIGKRNEVHARKV